MVAYMSQSTDLFLSWRSQSYSDPRGYSLVKAYSDVPPKWVTFSPNILRHGSPFSQQIPERGPISQKLWRNCKISRSWGIKTLTMGLNLQTFWKKNNSQISHFWRRKILRYGQGFQTSKHAPHQKVIQLPPPPPGFWWKLDSFKLVQAISIISKRCNFWNLYKWMYYFVTCKWI